MKILNKIPQNLLTKLKNNPTLTHILPDNKPGLYFETKHFEVYLLNQLLNNFSINGTSKEFRLRLEIFDKSQNRWIDNSFCTFVYPDKNTELIKLCNLARNEFLKFEKQVCSQNLSTVSLLLRFFTKTKLFDIFQSVL